MSRITFGGLASGLDTNSMINQLIELERQPIVQKEQRIQVLEQVKDAWRDINMRLRHLHSTVQELSKEENLLSKQAVSTNTSYVQATADSSAENATYELKVNKLATNHTVAMQNDIQTLLGKSTAESMGLTGNFILNGVKIEIESGDSLTDLQNKINNSEADVEASIIAGHLILKSKTSGLEGAMAMSYVSGDDVLNTLEVCDSEGGFYNKTLPVNHTVSMQSDIESLLGMGMDATEPMGLAGIFAINGTQIEVESGDSLEALRDKINSSAADVEASVNAGQLILESQTSGLGGLMAMSYVSGDDVLNTLEIYDGVGGFYDETLPTNYTVSMQSDIESLLGMGMDATEPMGLAGIFAINGTQIEVESGDSLEDLRDKINSSAADVEANINAGQLILESQTGGPEGDIAMSYISGDDLLNTLGIYDSGGGSFFKETLKAQDAEFSINGIDVTRSSNEVKDLIDGVTFRLYGGGAESVYVKISTDTEKAVAAVTAFVEQYNSIHTFIREKLEKPDEDSGVTVGLLQGDTTLMKIERNLRSLVNSPVSNYRYETEEGWEQKEYYCFASLGVTTIDKEGYLQFDPEKLASVLEDDPEAVFEVLKFEIEDEEGVGTGQFDGVGVTLDNYLKRLLIAEQDSLGRTSYPIAVREEEAVQRRIEELQRRIEIREERLLRYEERLITQFTALEKYIAQMQSQSQDFDNLVNQLTGFGNSKK